MELITYGMIGSIVLGMFALSGFKRVKPSERGIKNNQVIPPGITYKLGNLDTVNISEKTVRIHSHPVITKDNITCMVDANVTYKISDVPESVIRFHQTGFAQDITDHIKSELLEAFSLYTLKEIPHSKIKIIGNARNNSIALSRHYSITDIEFTKIAYPQDIQDSINKIITKQNEKEAAKKTVEAEKIKQDGLKKIQDEQSQANRNRILAENEAKKRSLESLARTKAEAIDMIRQKADQSLKEIEVEMKKLFEDAKEKSTRSIDNE